MTNSMNTDETVKLSEREEIESLLPWFTTNRLDAEDHARVQAYIDANPDMKSQVTMVLDERHATVLSNESITRSSRNGLEQLRQAIEAEKTLGDRVQERASGWRAQITSLFTAPTPSAVRWAGAAATVVLIAQFAAIGSLMSDRPATPQSPYTTASGPKAGTTEGARVLVQFKDTASAAQIAAFLQSVDAEITAGPKPGGLFEVRLSKSKLSSDELQARTEQILDEKDLVKLVIPQGS